MATTLAPTVLSHAELKRIDAYWRAAAEAAPGTLRGRAKPRLARYAGLEFHEGGELGYSLVHAYGAAFDNPDLIVRAVMHPHGTNAGEFDSIFTRNVPVIFVYHGYPALIHRLTYKRPNADRFHVRGCREKGSTTTPFEMTVRNGFGLVTHRRYIEEHGEDLPEIRDSRWRSTG